MADYKSSGPPSGTATVLRQYWQATRPYHTDMAVSTLLPLSNVLLFVVLPLFASKVLAELVTNRQDIWQNFWIATALAVVGLLCNTIGIRYCMRLQAKVMDALYVQAFGHLIRRSVGFYNNQVGGRLVSDANDYMSSYGQLFNAGFIGAFTFAATAITGLVIILFSSLPLGLLLIVLLAGLIVWTRYENKRRASIRAERLAISKRLIAHLSDSLVNAITVKTFAKEQQEYDTGRAISTQLRDTRIKDWQRTVSNESLRVGVLFAAELLLIASLIIITSHDPAILATGIFAFTYTINLLGRFFTINTTFRQLDEALLHAQPMAELLQQTPEIQDQPDAKPLVVSKGAITLQNVTFWYPDSGRNTAVFDGLNLTIQPGEKVGLVGHSGGGKSTLTRLLLRFDDITGGSITIDDQDLRSIKQSSLRDQIAYVPQEPLLFHRSVHENIAYGKSDASMAAVKAAARKAHAANFIDTLPQGYDTIVGERGVKLSGGQRQRIAIARAILKNAPILVLDEATSALDSESEKAIQSALWELMRDKTTLVIAHRLSTIQQLDRIIVLSEGRIIEDGSHHELLALNGTYAKLWKHQSGGFIEE